MEIRRFARTAITKSLLTTALLTDITGPNGSQAVSSSALVPGSTARNIFTGMSTITTIIVRDIVEDFLVAASVLQSIEESFMARPGMMRMVMKRRGNGDKRR